MPPQPPFPMRPLGLEYIVTGALDGFSEAPAFAVPPAPGDYDPETQMLTQTVPTLGLVDLTGLPGGSGQLADRIVKWIIVLGPNGPTSTDNVAVSFDGIIAETDVTIPPPFRGIYSRRCILVPQTAQLRLNGMFSNPGQAPIVVRMGIWMPHTRLELAAMLQSCCCTEPLPSTGVSPFFTPLPLAA